MRNFMPKHLRENILHLCFLSKLRVTITGRPIAYIFFHQDKVFMFLNVIYTLFSVNHSPPHTVLFNLQSYYSSKTHREKLNEIWIKFSHAERDTEWGPRCLCSVLPWKKWKASPARNLLCTQYSFNHVRSKRGVFVLFTLPAYSIKIAI